MGRGSSGSMGLAVAWRFLVSRSVSGFLDWHGMARLLHSLGARFGGSCDGGAMAWV